MNEAQGRVFVDILKKFQNRHFLLEEVMEDRPLEERLVVWDMVHAGLIEATRDEKYRLKYANLYQEIKEEFPGS